MRRGKIRYGLAVCLTTAAMMTSQLCAWAAAPFVSWQKGEKDHQAQVSVTLPDSGDIPGGVSALQLGLRLEAENKDHIQEVTFTFDSSISSNETVTVKDYVYDEEEGVLTVFAAGNDITLLEAGKTQKLGIVTAKATEDIRVYAFEAEVAGEGEKKTIDLGDQKDNSCTLKASETEPDDPGNPSDPDNPSDPSDPDNPGDPSDPDNPDNPDNPSDPDNPDNPDDPDNPNNPSGPSIMGRPGRGGGSGSSSGRRSGMGYSEPVSGARETAGTWEWTGTVWRFKLSSGSYARDTWVYVKGEWYHLDQNSDMNTLWYQTPAGAWYYLGNSGAMKRGWIELSGVRYHLKEDSGKMDTGWFYCDNNWFYAQASGAMATGWQMINEKWYYLNPERPVPVKVTDPATGQETESVEGQRLYGAMYAGETTPDGFQVDESGARK